MGRCCSAYGCSNSDEKNKKLSLGLTFHRFPLQRPDILKAWLHAVKRKDFKPTDSSCLCSNHFTEEDFQYQPFTGRYRNWLWFRSLYNIGLSIKMSTIKNRYYYYYIRPRSRSRSLPYDTRKSQLSSLGVRGSLDLDLDLVLLRILRFSSRSK